MTSKDFTALVDRIVEMRDNEKRLIVLEFIMDNGGYFNERFNRDVFYGRYCAKMEKEGK